MSDAPALSDTQDLVLLPNAWCSSIPYHGVKLISILGSIIDETAAKSIEHRIADEQNCLVSGVDTGAIP